MLEFVPLTSEHIINLYPRIRGDAKGLSLDQISKYILSLSSKGTSYAAVDNDVTIAVLGVVNGGFGAGQAWMIGSVDVPKYIRMLTELCVIALEDSEKNMGLHRVQAEVLVSKPKWIIWAKKLGFEKEGIMRKYTLTKEDCVLMARVRD